MRNKIFVLMMFFVFTCQVNASGKWPPDHMTKKYAEKILELEDKRAAFEKTLRADYKYLGFVTGDSIPEYYYRSVGDLDSFDFRSFKQMTEQAKTFLEGYKACNK